MINVTLVSSFFNNKNNNNSSSNINEMWCWRRKDHQNLGPVNLFCLELNNEQELKLLKLQKVEHVVCGTAWQLVLTVLEGTVEVGGEANDNKRSLKDSGLISSSGRWRSAYNWRKCQLIEITGDITQEDGRSVNVWISNNQSEFAGWKILDGVCRLPDSMR